jgi:hypothetical protein
MLVPGWDFVLDRFEHGHIAVMRGVEDGFSIVRAAKQGYLTVSDDRGRILAETRSNLAPFATLLADVPAGHERTIYSWLGDWFGWLSCALFGYLLLRNLLDPKRTDSVQSTLEDAVKIVSAKDGALARAVEESVARSITEICWSQN